METHAVAFDAAVGQALTRFRRAYTDAATPEPALALLRQRSPQRVEGVAGTVEQVIRIAEGGQNIDSGQYVLGNAGRTPARRTTSSAPPAVGASVDAGEAAEQHLRELLDIQTRRLRELELQAAHYGSDVPAHVALQIQEARAEIARLRQALGGREDAALA